MTIRNRLLCLLLPPVILLFGFSYWISHARWSQDIINSYSSRLQLIAIGCAQTIEGEEHQNLLHYKNTPLIGKNEAFRSYTKTMQSFAGTVPSLHLYTTVVKPVLAGDTVLQDQPEGPANPINDGKDPLLAYRKVYLLYAVEEGHPVEMQKLGAPYGSSDFCQNKEHEMYYSEHPTTTRVYRSLRTGRKMLTAYAPIHDEAHNIVAFVGADIPLASLQPEIRKGSFLIIALAAFTFTLTIASIRMVANRISKPLRNLHDTALAIAGGEYGRQVQLDGPLEAQQLSDSFNIMSSCLEERHTGTVDARSVSYHSAQTTHFLQCELFDQVLPKDLPIEIIAFHYWGELEGRGRRLFLSKQEDGLSLGWHTASSPGLKGLLQLASKPADLEPETGILLRTSTPRSWFTFGDTSSFFTYIWSQNTKTLSHSSDNEWKEDELLLIGNETFDELLSSNGDLHRWLEQFIFSLFDQPLELIADAISQEMNHLLQKSHHKKNIFIIVAR